MILTDGIAICNHCKKQFAKPSTGLEIGLAADQQQMRGIIAFLAKLQEHMIQRHPQIIESLMAERDQFYGMRVVSQFQLHDANLEDQQDRLRWQIHQATLRATISDRNIAGVSDEQAKEIAQLFYSQELMTEATLVMLIRERMMKMLTETRNALQEPGRYAIQTMNPPNPTDLGNQLPKM